MPERPQPAYLPIFRRDIQEVLQWSERHFGAAGADRYALLIRQALRDIYAEPLRLGAKARPDLAANAYTYHLALSRHRVTGDVVKKPRHFVLYRSIEASVEFGRLLHDSRDLALHLPYTATEE